MKIQAKIGKFSLSANWGRSPSKAAPKRKPSARHTPNKRTKRR